MADALHIECVDADECYMPWDEASHLEDIGTPSLTALVRSRPSFRHQDPIQILVRIPYQILD